MLVFEEVRLLIEPQKTLLTKKKKKKKPTDDRMPFFGPKTFNSQTGISNFAERKGRDVRMADQKHRRH